MRMLAQKIFNKLKVHLMICDNITILAKNIRMTLIRPIHPKWADRYDFIMPID